MDGWMDWSGGYMDGQAGGWMEDKMDGCVKEGSSIPQHRVVSEGVIRPSVFISSLCEGLLTRELFNQFWT